MLTSQRTSFRKNSSARGSGSQLQTEDHREKKKVQLVLLSIPVHLWAVTATVSHHQKEKSCGGIIVQFHISIADTCQL